MRYEIGQKVIFIHQLIKNSHTRKNGQPSPFPAIFIPWEQEIETIKFKVLTVAEHHKVPNQWETDENVKDCDGFIFVEDNGDRWLNQYPRAHCEQMGDTADGRVTPDIKKEDERAVLDGMIEYFQYEDVTRTLETMLRGVRDLKEKRPHWSEMLQIHIDYVIEQVKKVTGASIVIEPLKFERKDGTFESYPDILWANVVW